MVAGSARGAAATTSTAARPQREAAQVDLQQIFSFSQGTASEVCPRAAEGLWRAGEAWQESRRRARQWNLCRVWFRLALHGPWAKARLADLSRAGGWSHGHVVWTEGSGRPGRMLGCTAHLGHDRVPGLLQPSSSPSLQGTKCRIAEGESCLPSLLGWAFTSKNEMGWSSLPVPALRENVPRAWSTAHSRMDGGVGGCWLLTPGQEELHLP